VYFSSIRNAFKDIRQNGIAYIFLFFQLVGQSDLKRYFLSDSFLYVNITFSLTLLIYKRRLNLRELILFIFLFSLIALIPIIKWGFVLRLYGGYILRITTGLFIIQYFRNRFIPIYENLIFILAYFAIIFYILQQFVPGLFRVFDPISQFILVPDNYDLSRQYFFLYFYRPALSFRNSGFMWEPAAFSGVLTWAILFNLYINKFEINRKLIVLVLAAITTFSIGFFVYFSIILLLYSLQKNKKAFKYFFLLIPIIILVKDLSIVQDNLFVMERKIQTEVDSNIGNAIDLSVSAENYSRVGGFIVNGKYFLKWPFGYGILDTSNASNELRFLGASPNSLMKMFVQWGILGITLILFSTWQTALYLKNQYHINIKPVGSFLTILILLGPYIGNPFSKQPITFAVLLFGVVLYKKGKKISYQKYISSTNTYGKTTPISE